MGLARSIRVNPCLLGNKRWSALRTAHTTANSLPFSLFFHSRDVLAVLMHSVSMQRWADAQEKFKGVAEVVSVIAVEAIRSTVEGELCAETDIDAVAMRQVADVTDRVTA